MPEEQKDTAPAVQEEDEKLPSDGLVDDGEIAAAAEKLAAATFADEAASGTSETQQSNVDDFHDPLADPELWKPLPPTEDCPVCLVPLPLEHNKRSHWSCCGKTICNACARENDRALQVTNEKRKRKELTPLDQSCPFCREAAFYSNTEFLERIERRIHKGDVEAMLQMAAFCLDGLEGVPKDETKALKLFKRAADMGSARALYHLGSAYILGHFGAPEGGIVYLENAAKMGDVGSSYLLATLYSGEGNLHLANKHLRLAAEAGDKDSIKNIWKHFYERKLSKTDLEEILRAHHAACDEMDSEDRQRSDARDEAMSGKDDTLKRLYGCYYLGYLNAKQLKEVLRMHRKGCGLEEICKFIANAKKANESS